MPIEIVKHTNKWQKRLRTRTRAKEVKKDMNNDN
jgi:hypothetical protein